MNHQKINLYFIFFLFVLCFSSSCTLKNENKKLENVAQKTINTETNGKSKINLDSTLEEIYDTLYYDSSVKKKDTSKKVDKIINKIVKYSNCSKNNSLEYNHKK